MAAIATGTAVDGAGQGFIGLLDCLAEFSVPLLAAVNGVAVGLGFTLLAHCDLVLVDCRRPAPRALRRAGCPGRGREQLLVPSHHGLAARGAADPAHLGLGQRADELVSLGLALRVCADRRRPQRDGGTGSKGGGSPPRRHPRHHLSGPRHDAVTPSSRPTATNRVRSGRLLGSTAQHGSLADFARQARLTVRLGITAALTDLDLAPDRLAAAVESSGSTRSGCPSTRICRSVRTPPRPWSQGVRLDDYKRCLDPLVRARHRRRRHRRVSGSAPASSWSPNTTPSCSPSRSPRSTTSRQAGSPSASASGGTAPRRRTTASTSPRRWFVVREHLAAMEASVSHEQAEYHGEFVDFGPSWSWPKPVQQPRVRTLIGGGAHESVLSAPSSPTPTAGSPSAAAA